MKLTSHRSHAVGWSRTALPALFLFVHVFGACGDKDDGRPHQAPPGSGGSGDGDQGSGGIEEMGGEGGSETGGSASGGTEVGGMGGVPPVEELTCDDLECHSLAVCDDSGEVPECICPVGLEGDECTDENECLDPTTCGPDTACVNTHGGFICTCLDGQVQSGGSCVDVQECDAAPCDDNATCLEGVDTFSCSCDSGYYGNGFYCSSTDNCDPNPCDGGTCITTPSGYVCQCAEGQAGAADCSTTCDTLSFADPALEAAVRDAISKPSGDITQADIRNTTALYLAGEDIVDLGGLECWGHLEILDLNDTPIGEMPATYPNALAPLTDLSRLKALYLGCTGVTDLAVLSEHPTLERLSIARYESCQSSSVDLTALSTVTSLRWLDVSGLELATLASISSLSALQSLAASNNAITSVAPLSTLENLKELLLDGNQLSDIDGLSALSLLQELDLAENQLTSVDSLTSLSALQTLSVGDNDLASLPDLSVFENLSFFDARNNQIDALSAVSSLGAMMWVGLAGNEISTLDALVGSAMTGSLSLRDNPIDCDDEAENLLSLSSQGLSVISDCTN